MARVPRRTGKRGVRPRADVWRARSGDRSARRATSYKAFISYSHAIDGKLAPALQGALHRFAKPWYRLRAVRVFRDETSLSVTPALWSSIELALSNSEYFILLASPEAAASPWVDKEAAYWCHNKPKDNLFLALTGGKLGWDDRAGDFDRTTTTAVPPSLLGQFSEEPRYIDLRWARDEVDISLAHARFRECVADLAAPLHGRPKDELLGDDVRYHRRALRLARAAGSLLVTLTLLAATLAFWAVRQRDVARDERDVARSRQLAAQAVALADKQPDRSLLLSVEALESADSAEARRALLAGIQRSRHLMAFLHGSSPLHEVSFSPDGKVLTATGEDGNIMTWDMTTRERLGERARITGEPSRWSAFSPDGHVAASVEGKMVVLWDVATRERVGELVGGHLLDVNALEFSPDGKILASGGHDNRVVLWDVETRQRRGVPLGGHESTIMTLDFSPDGSTLASGGGNTVLLWKVETGERQGPPLYAHQNGVEGIAFSPDGKALASAGADGLVRLWDVRVPWAARMLYLLGGHSGGAMSVAFSPDGTLAASAGLDQKVILWSVQTPPPLGRVLSDERHVAELAVSPDGKTLATGGQSHDVTLWDLARGDPRSQPLAGHQDSVTALAFSPDGKTLASGAEDGNIILWDVQAHHPRGPPLDAHSGDVNSLAFSRDGTTLASGGYDKTVVLWDVENRRPRREPLIGHEDLVSAVAFSPDGKTLASGSRDKSIIVWDVERHRRRLPALAGHQDLVTTLAFSPDGKVLASGSRDEQVLLWNPGSRSPGPQALSGQRGPVASLAFSPDGATLASAGQSEAIILWDVRSRQPAGELIVGPQSPTSAPGTNAIAFTPDGRSLVSDWHGSGPILWDVDPRFWQSVACAIANRDLDRAEWDQFLGEARPYRRTCPDRAIVAPATTTTVPTSFDQWLAAVRIDLFEFAGTLAELDQLSADPEANRVWLYRLVGHAGKTAATLANEPPPPGDESDIVALTRLIEEVERRARTAANCVTQCQAVYASLLEAALPTATGIEQVIAVAQSIEEGQSPP